jgi:uncharacterized membrane protein HdeD (DUF308 family)
MSSDGSVPATITESVHGCREEPMSESAGVERDVADVVGDVGGARWWGFGYGAVSVIAGAVALAWPDVTVVVLAIVFGVQLFVLGLFRVVEAFAIPETSAAAKVLSVVVGLLSFIVGILCLRSPLQTVVVLTLVLGLFWLIHGIADIVIGVSRRDQPGRVWIIIGGVIGVLAGIVVLSSPQASAVTLAWLVGILLVLQGIVVLVVTLGRPRAIKSAPAPLESTTPIEATGGPARHSAG